MYTSLTGSPHARSCSYQPDCVVGALSATASSSGVGMPLSAPAPGTARPCTIRLSGRVAVTRGSFCRSEPAAVLRGFTYSGLPASACRSFSWWNASTGMNTSPRTSMTSGQPDPASRAGAAAIVRMFGVTSSPVTPSPRVAARTRTPLR